MMWYYGDFATSWWLMSIMMILFWALIVVGIVALARYLAPGAGEQGKDGRDRSFQILRERYARGEIDEREFQKKKAELVK